MDNTKTIEDYQASPEYIRGADAYKQAKNAKKAFDRKGKCPHEIGTGFMRIAWWHGWYDMRHHTKLPMQFKNPATIHDAAKGDPAP